MCRLTSCCVSCRSAGGNRRLPMRENVTDEIRDLRRTLRDVVALSTLPAVWVGYSPEGIAQNLADVLLNTLPVDVIYIQLRGHTEGDIVEVAHSRNGPVAVNQVQVIAKALAPWLKTGVSDPPRRILNPLGSGTLRIAGARFGHSGDFGVLVTGSKRPDFPTKVERLLLGVGANQAAIAIQRNQAEAALHRAHDELEQRVLERTAELVKASEALQESETRFRLMVEGCKDYAIFMLDPEGRVSTWNAGAADIKGYRAEEIIGQHFSCFYPPEDLERRKPDMELRAATAEGRFEDEGWRVRKNGTQFWANVIITAIRDKEGKLIGFSKVTRDLTERKKAEDTMAALYEANLKVQEQWELSERLSRLLRTAETVVAVDRANILLADPEGRWLEAVASLGTEEPLEAIRVPIGPEGGGVAQAYLTQQMITWDGRGPVPEELRLKPPYEQIAALRSRVFANVPLVVVGKAIGVLGVDRKHSRRPFEPATLQVLKLFAAQAALAIGNAQLYEELNSHRDRLRALMGRILRIKEEEAKRIAHGLHDEAGQLLASVHLALEEMAAELPSSARAHVEKIRNQLDRIGGQLRRLSHELRPMVLDDLGLQPALHFLAQGVSARTGIPVTVEGSTGGRLSPVIETAIYRIVQEALANATKHAQATSVRIQLQREADTIRCAVRDDGVGFDLRAVVAKRGKPGLGLLGIRERLDALDGKCSIESAPGRGTEFLITIPISGG